MKKKILAIVLTATALVNLAPVTSSAKTAHTYKVRGTIRNFNYTMQYEDGEKLTGRGFDICTADGNIWEMFDTDTDAHFKDGQKVIVKISDNGTPKDKTDDRIISVKKAK
nr:MAG TPA: Putative pertussis-like toxin subunit toxin, glycan, TOXIN [Bacteriophage sp.]